MSTFDFKDGNGPVPSHRHPNGGGWVADTATVANTAYVGLYARVYEYAVVSGSAEAYENARIYGSAVVYENAQIFGYARVSGDAVVYGNARVYGNAWVSENARVSGNARIGSEITGMDLSGIPIVPDLDRRIAEAVRGGNFDMGTWHCGSTHCRAGWAITLAGEAGAALEARVGPWLAGALIYVASTGRTTVPDFFASNEDALADIERLAKEAT